MTAAVPQTRTLPLWWPQAALAAVVAGSLALRLFRLDLPGIPVFDEGLFYIPAARAYLAGLPDPNFEHPPLGKELFAAGIALAGDNLVGWRIMSAIFGSAGVALTAWLGGMLWGSLRAGLAAAAILATDVLWLLFSRLMMYDIFLATLVLLALCLGWRYRQTGSLPVLAAAGLAVGLAGAVKWSGFWALAPLGLAIAFAPGASRRAGAMAGRMTLVGLGALAGYGLPWFYHVVVLGYGPGDLLAQHLRMLGYQVQIGAPPDRLEQLLTPLRWLLDQPLVFTARDDRSVWVVALANPLLFWGGIVATVVMTWRAAHRRPRWTALASPGTFLVTWVLVFYLPWFLFPRVKYFYYLMPLLPALALAVTGLLRNVPASTGGRFAHWQRLGTAAYGCGLAAVLAGLYPALIGLWSAPHE